MLLPTGICDCWCAPRPESAEPLVRLLETELSLLVDRSSSDGSEIEVLFVNRPLSGEPPEPQPMLHFSYRLAMFSCSRLLHRLPEFELVELPAFRLFIAAARLLIADEPFRPPPPFEAKPLSSEPPVAAGLQDELLLELLLLLLLELLFLFESNEAPSNEWCW